MSDICHFRHIFCFLCMLTGIVTLYYNQNIKNDVSFLCILLSPLLFDFSISPVTFVLTHWHILSIGNLRGLIEVRSRWRVVPGTCHNISSDSTEPDPNAPHHAATIPQPCAATRLQLHKSPLLHRHARPAQYLPVWTCCFSGENS